MKKSFTIAALLCATLVAGAQAQANQSSGKSKTLVELEAQAKAKKKTQAQTSTQTPQTATPTATPTATAQKPAPRTTRKTAARTPAKPATKTVAKKTPPPPRPAATAPAEPSTATAQTPQPAAGTTAPAPAAAAAPAAQPASAAPAPAAAAPAAPVDPMGSNAPKIYKANDLPDAFKFKTEMDREKKKPATEGAGAAEAAAAPAAPTSAPAATAPATPAGAAPASAPAARVAPASAAPASATPVAAAPAATAPAPATSASAPATAPAPATASAPAAGTVPAAASGPAVASGSGATAQKSKPAPKPTPARGGAKTANTSAKTWRDRGYISGNFGWQASAATFSDTRTLTLATGDTEPRHLTANYDVKAGPAFDIGAGVRFWKSLGIAGSVTRYSISNDIAINGDVPHPFFFNRPRPVSGATPGTREELAIHLDAVWVVPANKKLQVAIFGGPTFFNAKQTVVSDFTYSESYPFDDATFTAGTSAEESKSVTGFNAGVDVGYFFNDVFGIGGVVRFSRGTLKSSIGDLDVGGPEFGGGIRIRLRQSTAPKSPRVPPAKPAPAPAPKKK